MKRILVLRGGALGDFVLGLPALQALRRAFPRAHLELVAPAAVLPLARGFIDLATPLERAEMALLFQDGTFSEEVAGRYGNLDLVVLWLADGNGAVRRNFQRLGAGQILWAPALPRQPGRHAADHLLESLRPLGIRTGLDSDGAYRDWNIQGLDSPPGVPTIAIHAGSGGAWKCWSPKRFASVAEYMLALGHRVVLVQGPADSVVVERVRSIVHGQPLPVVAGLDVEDLAAFLSSCSCYLGNDSGVTHLAAALGTPTVAIFGPTDPAVWGPRGPKVTVLRSIVDCSPCTRERAVACPTKTCLEGVQVEQVVLALDDLLKDEDAETGRRGDGETRR